MNQVKRIYETTSPEETEALGARLASALAESGRTNAFIALYGEMGVGKTAFTRGFAAALGFYAVKSPTYTVVNEYKTGKMPIFHFDMYRIGDEDDLLSIGYDDYLKEKGYVLCEWSERIPDDIPSDAIRVTIARADDDARRSVTMELPEGLAV